MQFRIFQQHHAEVQSKTSSDRLLTFNLSEWLGEPYANSSALRRLTFPSPSLTPSKAFVDEEWKQG